MSTPFIYYDNSTGEIDFYGSVGDTSLLTAPSPDKTMLENVVADSINHYVDVNDNNLVKNKLNAIISVDKTTVTADGLDEITLTGLSPGDKFIVYLEGIEVDAFPYNPGNDTMTFDTIGSYNLLIKSIKHETYEVTIDAV